MTIIKKQSKNHQMRSTEKLNNFSELRQNRVYFCFLTIIEFFYLQVSKLHGL